MPVDLKGCEAVSTLRGSKAREAVVVHSLTPEDWCVVLGTLPFAVAFQPAVDVVPCHSGSHRCALAVEAVVRHCSCREVHSVVVAGDGSSPLRMAQCTVKGVPVHRYVSSVTGASRSDTAEEPSHGAAVRRSGPVEAVPTEAAAGENPSLTSEEVHHAKVVVRHSCAEVATHAGYWVVAASRRAPVPAAGHADTVRPNMQVAVVAHGARDIRVQPCAANERQSSVFLLGEGASALPSLG